MQASSLRRCMKYTLSALFFSLVVSARASADTVLSELDDAAARMQYAYYTDDPRALEGTLGSVGALRSTPVPGLNEYFTAYGHWKLAQLYAEAQIAGAATSRSSAAKAAQECERHAKAAIAKDGRMAEAYALLAICHGNPSGGNCAAKPLKTALELEPQNPRVRLIDLLCLDRKEWSSPTIVQRARSLVNAFDSAPASRPGKPDWGQAEASLLLGQICLQRGDSVAARDSAERALVVAPDYRKAQQLLQAAARTSG